MYRNGCPDDKPEGWYTGTPYGTVDIVPLAAGGPLGNYLALTFLGWNTFDETDFARLLAYVQAGGTLLLGRPHLSTHTVRNHPAAPPRQSAALEALLGPLPISGGRMEHKVGNGTVIYYPHDAYPCDTAIRAAYEHDLRELGARAAAAEIVRGWVRGSEDVEFAAYDRPDGLRDLFLLNIDWWSGTPSHSAHLLLGRRPLGGGGAGRSNRRHHRRRRAGRDAGDRGRRHFGAHHRVGHGCSPTLAPACASSTPPAHGRSSWTCPVAGCGRCVGRGDLQDVEDRQDGSVNQFIEPILPIL